MTLRDATTDLRTGNGRVSGSGLRLEAAVEAYALAGEQGGDT